MMLKLTLLLLSLASAATAAKVAIFLLPLSNSHVIFTIRVAEELARDHDVVIIRPGINPAASEIVSKHPRVREFRTAGASAETFAAFKKSEHDLIWAQVPWYSWRGLSSGYVNVITEACNDMVADDDFMNQMKEEAFDIALTHSMDACPAAVIYASRIPQFGYLLSTPLSRIALNHIGIPVLPSIFPGHLLDASNEMTFGQRLKNFLLENTQALVSRFLQPISINAAFRAKYGEQLPSVGELVTKARFLIANVHPDIEFPVPVTSKVTYIGGLAMSNETKKLEEPYASFIEKAEKVVFVSFGTVAEPKDMPLAWKRAFVQLFESNPSIHFIWRMDDAVEVPKNVLKRLWHPQNDILGHPKVAAFITHAGYNSLGESIASGTPLVTVPLFGDQMRNSRLVVHRGFGVRVEKDKLSYETLNVALHTVLEEPSFAASAAALNRIVFSSPVRAGDALRHAINFALENPEHNRDLPSLPLYQLYSLDIIFLLTIVPLLMPMLFRWYYWSCCKMAYKEKEKMN